MDCKQKLVREIKVLKSAFESMTNMYCGTLHILMFFLEGGGGGGGWDPKYVSSEIMSVKYRVLCTMLENAEKINIEIKQKIKLLLHVQNLNEHLYMHTNCHF